MLNCNRRLMTPARMAEMIVITFHPYIPENDPEIPFIRQHQDLPDGTMEFFCYQHQFTIHIKMNGEYAEIYPQWRRYPDEEMEFEKAIATLHKCFTYISKKR